MKSIVYISGKVPHMALYVWSNMWKYITPAYAQKLHQKKKLKNPHTLRRVSNMQTHVRGKISDVRKSHMKDNRVLQMK